MNNQTNQSILKPILIGLAIWLITSILTFLFSNRLPLGNLLQTQISLYWLIISCIGVIVFLTLCIILIFKFHKLQKELKGKTKRCLFIKHLSPLSKQLLNEHINKANTITMYYGSNEEAIAELTRLNIIAPYDKINYKLNFWFFECLDKNPSLLDYET